MIQFVTENFFSAIVLLTIFTQIVIPAFVPNLKFFWLFKKTIKLESTNSKLEDEVEVKVKEFKETVSKVDENLKKAGELKSKTKV